MRVPELATLLAQEACKVNEGSLADFFFKTLSECVSILWHFKQNKHVDAELSDQFLSSGWYQRCAERFMRPG